MTKVTKQLYKLIKKLKRQGLTQRVIAESFSISQTTVSFIINARNYQEYLANAGKRKTLTLWDKIVKFIKGGKQ